MDSVAFKGLMKAKPITTVNTRRQVLHPLLADEKVVHGRFLHPLIMRTNMTVNTCVAPKERVIPEQSTPRHISYHLAGVTIEMYHPDQTFGVMKLADHWAAVGVKPTIVVQPLSARNTTCRDEIIWCAGAESIEELYECERADADMYKLYPPAQNYITHLQGVMDDECQGYVIRRDPMISLEQQVTALYRQEIAACQVRQGQPSHVVLGQLHPSFN